MLLVSHDEDANAYYYSGNPVDPTVILATKKDAFISSLEPERHADAFGESVTYAEGRKLLKAKLAALKGKRVAYDDTSANAHGILKLLEKKKIKPVPFGKQLSAPREIKEPAEIERIHKAQEITLKSLSELGGFAGRTENEVAGQLEWSARRHGGALNAFPPMVLSGQRSSLFHNTTTNKKIRGGENVLVDCGATYERYCADYTRTFSNGSTDKRCSDALEAVKESFKAARRFCKPGIQGKKVGAIALEVIKEYGFEKESHKAVGLALGHHVGLKVHDGPRLEERRLRKGMVVTIEPGIYTKEFGVRWEDTIVL